MDGPSPEMRVLAQRLLALEAASQPASDSPGHVGVQVCEKLRFPLTRFAGPDGFTALLRRALVLARAEVSSLETVEVKADGRLDGFEKIAADAANGGTEAAIAIIAHLLGLLATFIGEPLTHRLVREARPELSADE